MRVRLVLVALLVRAQEALGLLLSTLDLAVELPAGLVLGFLFGLVQALVHDVGVLAGEPLFVCQYRMARGHWQIVKHRADGSSREGGFKTFDLDQAPAALIDVAVRAARPIGDGFYGVDIKQTESGFIVMEVNDNPNLEHGIEDVVGKDEIWIRLLKWFIERFEQ